jgi:hypothetical protein
MIVTDDYINELFKGTRFGESIDNCVIRKREQLYKTLTELVKGYWSGHTAYHIAVNGGFIVDGKKGSPKQLTLLGRYLVESRHA